MEWLESLLNSMAQVLVHYRWQIEQQLEICHQSMDLPAQYSQLMRKLFVILNLLVVVVSS